MKEMSKVLAELIRRGGGESEVGVTVWEEIESSEELREAFHKGIPNVLRKVFEDVGLVCTIYHKKDDVWGPEYVANCRLGDRPVAVGVDVVVDEFGAHITYVNVSFDSEYPDNLLVYYHPCGTSKARKRSRSKVDL